ncbi:MAG: hypothetical protein HQK83_12950 [Fibrobacteria bacterium]|nr:hypothetical protein [Fibrobacteria bacterium]
MKNKKIVKQAFLSLLTGAFIFTACNIFNPSGEGTLPESTEGMVSVGQSRLKDQDWSGAMEAFGKAIEADSTNSLAYYGYAKAVRFKYNLNGLEMSKEFTDTSSGQIPFITLGNEDATMYLKSSTLIKPVLSKLAKRDSLTRWFALKDMDPVSLYTLDPTSGMTRKNFINNYLTKSGTPGYYSEEDFPLSDGFINYEKILPDLTLITLVHTIMKIKDLNNDTVINEDDNIELVSDILSALDSGNVEDNISAIMNKILTDTAAQAQTIKDFNSALDNFSEGTDGISEVLGAVSSMGLAGDESDSSGSALTDQIGDVESVMDSVGDAAKFFRIADGIDNDGDGCVDEEVYDSKDNDGDGIVDEDLRVVSLLTLNTTTFKEYEFMVIDSTDGNDVNYVTDGFNTRLSFTTVNGFWASDAITNDQRFTILNKIEGQTPPYNLSDDDLNRAKTTIGGCWSKFY